ncbi:unnamed protein product [Adineta ricciae]|uniref:Autophagy-related protein 27 n=1 Tax=Adineta ricciae TaxID=249248 RepID=A0A815ESJ0_ADIRI|nr:unnamed protein product [Adineta ricciae]CAF1314228.1 unnamed protein product [Adineta ricciae]
MMHISLTSIGLLLLCLIYHASAQHTICNSLEGYDTKFLLNAVQWRVTADYQCLGHPAANCTYFFSFCQTGMFVWVFFCRAKTHPCVLSSLAPNCLNEYSACQNSSASSNITVLGALSTTVFYENDPGEKGFYALFARAPNQTVSNTTTCAPSFKIKFRCNLQSHWFAPVGDETANTPEPTDIEIDDQCLTTMTFDFPGACIHEDEPKKGLSGGSVFLLILFSVLIAYFLVGVAYNGLYKHKSGIHLIPQAEFWISLPLLAIEGCRTTLGICSRSSSESRATYDSV